MYKQWAKGVPSFMAMTAVFFLMTQFNFIDNHWGLILIYSAQAPMGYMVQKGFFDTVSFSIDEAAREKTFLSRSPKTTEYIFWL